jgi:DNA modification methylase
VNDAYAGIGCFHRSFIGVEFNPEYVAIAEHRLNNAKLKI